MRTEPPESSLWNLNFEELEQELVESGLKPCHTKSLWRGLHRHFDTVCTDRSSYLPPLRRWMDAQASRIQPLVQVDQQIISNDQFTYKWLLRLNDGEKIETVLMAYQGRYTVCVSTQVGCAMGCVFCATGQSGFTRHLSPGEIVSQVLHAKHFLKARGETGLRNIVLMGMGEPLHNYESVMKALQMISDTRGLNIGPSRISISTVGVIPGILRMAEEPSPYNLAVSLHGANEQDRAQLVPISKRWSLLELMKACRVYCNKTQRRIFFEWTLIAGKNDSEEQALELATLLAGLNAHVNLIPLNPTLDYLGNPSVAATVEAFQKIVADKGFPCTVRQRRGIDVAAGCGQLRAN